MNDLLGEKPRIIRKLPAVKELIHPDEEQSEEVDVDAELVNDENGDDENALMDKIASFLTLNRDVMSMISPQLSKWDCMMLFKYCYEDVKLDACKSFLTANYPNAEFNLNK